MHSIQFTYVHGSIQKWNVVFKSNWKAIFENNHVSRLPGIKTLQIYEFKATIELRLRSKKY